MDKLQSLFIAEAEELISNLEGALLDFEKDLTNRESVREIFRVMHTLKGAAGMFGFESLTTLTHDLETVYDDIRDNKREATEIILDVTLRTVDHIKKILKDQHLQDPVNKANQLTLLKDIKALNGHSLEEPADTTIEKEVITYYVSFKPSADIFKSGNNPLYLVDDLMALGHGVVIPGFQPEMFSKAFEPERCYTTFEVILAGPILESEIKDVFLFVEDSSEVVVSEIAKGDLINESAFAGMLDVGGSLTRATYGVDILKNIASTIRAEVKVTASLPSQPSARTTNQGTSIRVSSEKLDELMNLVSELVTSQARLALLAEQNGIADLNAVSENIEKITRRLRDNAFGICLVSIETIVTRFQRLVRDLSKDLGKEVVFTAEGSETELDKSLIEKITDPILHIIRNAIDHGLESPQERLAKGKSPQGKIHFKAYHSGTYVLIEISDDGKGIDTNKIRAKAISKGLIKEDGVLTEKEILDLIFKPGFSTAEKITDVSGRGVGMDVVKRNIEAIHGEVLLESKVNEGTRLTIRLPLTLSIVDGMLVKIAASDYIIPLTAVDKCYEIQTQILNADEAQKIVFDGNLLPVFNLRKVFMEQPSESAITQVIKLNYDDFPVGITVDAVVGEYQAVMKPLGDMYQDQDEFSGATILGDGSVALVVDTTKFIRQLITQNKQN